jgi:molecular chaperone GrpE (heat shock protein)
LHRHRYRFAFSFSLPAQVMYDGIVSIHQILMKTFHKHGVEKIEPEIGAEMDPNRMMVSRMREWRLSGSPA